jgi:hypothetical protein
MNSALISSNRGSGQHGHLAMFMKDAVYDTISATPWTDSPARSGVPTIPPSAISAQVSRMHQSHSQLVITRPEFLNLDRVLLKIITDSAKALKLCPFHSPYAGLLDRPTKEIMDLLMASFGNILPQEL